MKLVNININIKEDNTLKVVDFIKAQQADVVTLQEVLRPLEDNVFENYKVQTVLDNSLKGIYPYRFFGPLQVTNMFLKNGQMHRDFGGYLEQGNEVISKFPIVSAVNEFYYKNFSYNTDVTHWKEEDHGRAVQIVVLEVAGQKVQILNVHGIWTPDKLGDARTVAECEYLIKAARRQDLPTVIVGDFNLQPGTESIALLNKEFINLVSQYKILSTRPGFSDDLDQGDNIVDYIFVNEKIKVNDFKRIDTNISDHFPFLLDFEILSDNL